MGTTRLYTLQLVIPVLWEERGITPGVVKASDIPEEERTLDEKEFSPREPAFTLSYVTNCAGNGPTRAFVLHLMSMVEHPKLRLARPCSTLRQYVR